MYPTSLQVRECRQYAEHCERTARDQSDPPLRQSYLEIQKRWLGPARGYEFSERLDFLSSVEMKNREVRFMIGAHE